MKDSPPVSKHFSAFSLVSPPSVPSLLNEEVSEIDQSKTQIKYNKFKTKKNVKKNKKNT